MARLRYSELSRADLEFIWETIADDSPRSAGAVLERLHDKIESLRAQPLFGHRHRFLPAQVRCLNCDGYLILYRYSANVVRIDRIIHHSRHLPDLDLPP
jgi:plasmid stabilization system protein ParE